MYLPLGHHTIYIGVHVPKSYRRRRRHKRKTGHKEKKEKERISENYSDKSDVENADESSSSILKPLSECPLGGGASLCLTPTPLGRTLFRILLPMGKDPVIRGGSPLKDNVYGDAFVVLTSWSRRRFGKNSELVRKDLTIFRHGCVFCILIRETGQNIIDGI